MADNFGLKIGLEGEKEFKKSISEINQTFKVLGSEMKLVTAQFDKNDNSIEALTARQQVLGKEVDAQRQKVETLRAALANATESFGENDRRTQQWQIQLNNAEAALIDLERQLDESTDALDKAGREMDDTGDQASNRLVLSARRPLLPWRQHLQQYRLRPLQQAKHWWIWQSKVQHTRTLY